MTDQITEIENGIIQHGKQSNRVYVMKTPPQNHSPFIRKIEALASTNHYDKIIAKVPMGSKEAFMEQGYAEEAQVPYFYQGKESCSFVSKYLCNQRKKVQNKGLVNQIIENAQKLKRRISAPSLEKSFVCRKAEKQDIPQMVDLYEKIFKTYPFPIHEAAYIEETMSAHVVYFGIWHQDQLIALSSSEMDWKSKNVEMTDFAVDQDYRGKNISSFLLQSMEKEMKRQGIFLAYTIARAVSHGMNYTFSKNGYDFAGTLVNNTQIAGSIESMNVWYKKL